MTPDAGVAPAEAATGGAATGIRLRPGCRRPTPPAWLVEPTVQASALPPLVVVHGITRKAAEIACRLAHRARAQGRTLLAPLFEEPAFKGYQRVFGRQRADLALITLLDALVEDRVLPSGPVDLAGFSGGAQFAHRFAWLYPHRVGRLTLAAAGWWTFPDAAPFPYGLGGGDLGPEDAVRWLRSNTPDFLDREITVAVGEADCVPDTRRGPAIDAQQGIDRVTRARRWCGAIAAAAERHGLEPRVTFRLLPGAGHDFGACADAGLDALLLPSTCPFTLTESRNASRCPRPCQMGLHDAPRLSC